MARSDEPCARQERRRVLRRGVAALLGVAMLSTSRGGHAATPQGAMRILCSGPAGSIPDLVARTIAEQLVSRPGQPALVDNRPGAAGQISVVALKAAPADGSSLLLAQGAIATVYPYLYPRLAYDPAVDLQPVSLASEMAIGLAIGPAVPTDVMTLDGFLDWARRNPLAVNIGSPGTGTLPHLLETLLLLQAGVTWQHIAYSGGPPAVTQLLGGQIAALALPAGLLRQHHLAGRIRILAISGSARSDRLPDVPSFVEVGYPELVATEWFAFFAPGRTSPVTVEALSKALQEAIARPEVAIAFSQAGMSPVSSTPQLLATRIASEQRYWREVVRVHGIRAE